jgi:hypothetical protein
MRQRKLRDSGLQRHAQRCLLVGLRSFLGLLNALIFLFFHNILLLLSYFEKTNLGLAFDCGCDNLLGTLMKHEVVNI